MASIGNVTVECPQCDAPLSVTLTAQTTGVADDGTVQVDVLADKTDIKLHALVCGR